MTTAGRYGPAPYAGKFTLHTCSTHKRSLPWHAVSISCASAVPTGLANWCTSVLSGDGLETTLLQAAGFLAWKGSNEACMESHHMYRRPAMLVTFAALLVLPTARKKVAVAKLKQNLSKILANR